MRKVWNEWATRKPKQEQLDEATAFEMGVRAFHKGINAPAMDPEFMSDLTALRLPVGGGGEALLRAWVRGHNREMMKVVNAPLESRSRMHEADMSREQAIYLLSQIEDPGDLSSGLFRALGLPHEAFLRMSQIWGNDPEFARKALLTLKKDFGL